MVELLMGVVGCCRGDFAYEQVSTKGVDRNSGISCLG